MELTLEQELKSRITVHKTVITTAYFTRKYIDKELAKGGIQLPITIIERDGLEYAQKKVQGYLCKGNLDEVYEQVWEKWVDQMPEHYNVMRSQQNTL